MPDIAATLTRKVGPLPLWAWGAIIGGGIVAAKVLSGGGGGGSQQVLGTSNVPLPDGFDGTGGIGSGPGIVGDLPDVSPIPIPASFNTPEMLDFLEFGNGVNGPPVIDEDASPFAGMDQTEIMALAMQRARELATPNLTTVQRTAWYNLTQAQRDAYNIANPADLNASFVGMTRDELAAAAGIPVRQPTVPAPAPTTA